MFGPAKRFILIVIMTIFSLLVALPAEIPLTLSWREQSFETTLRRPAIGLNFLGLNWQPDLELRQGLDIQGGMQLVLDADMSRVEETDRASALESARAIIERRVDLYGVNEPLVQTARTGDAYRIIVELAGVSDASEALELLGTTAQLDFRLQAPLDLEMDSDEIDVFTFLNSFTPTGLTGEQLRRATVQFDPNTGQPVIGLEFNSQGREQFATITRENVGTVLAIFLDEVPVTMPVIQTPILDGQAQISGEFDLEEAKQLVIQLNAGALPVPIEVLEQRTIGASLGQSSVEASVKAGLIGFALVVSFMIIIYGYAGILAGLSLLIYGVITLAVYKLLGIVVTLPGVAGLLLSLAMAVDATVLIFERMKEEQRLGKSFERSMKLGFGRAWTSIRDANLATFATAFILVNPLHFGFLNTSGVVRGFGVTLLVGVVIGLFTGVFVIRTLLEMFLAPPHKDSERLS